MANNFFYSVIYHINHGGKKQAAQNILFATEIEVDSEQIKNYILKRQKLRNAAVVLHSTNKLSKQTFITLGGNPHNRFE